MVLRLRPIRFLKWFFIYELTSEERMCKVLTKIRRLMKKGVSNEDIRQWLITTHQPIDRIWIRDKPTRRITVALEDEYGIRMFGYVTNYRGTYIDLIPALNQL